MDWCIFGCRDVDETEMIGKFYFPVVIVKFDGVTCRKEDAIWEGIDGKLVQICHGTKSSNKGHTCAVRFDAANAVNRKMEL